MIRLALLALMALAGSASAQDRGEWFRSLKQPGTKTSCCDVSDCKKTEARWQHGGWTARSRLTGEMRQVPHDRVLDDPKSIDGDAYLCEGPGGRIFCFIPPDFGT